MRKATKYLSALAGVMLAGDVVRGNDTDEASIGRNSRTSQTEIKLESDLQHFFNNADFLIKLNTDKREPYDKILDYTLNSCWVLIGVMGLAGGVKLASKYIKFASFNVILE